MIDYIDAIHTESARFADLVAAAPPNAPVPSCPGWSVADLTWHLLEVQYFWASIATDLLQSPETVVDLVRPSDDALPAMFRQQTQRLIDTLSSHEPDDACWSWHDSGHSIGWVRRRQAHEALIHRVDAELAAGQRSPIDPLLAADGIDEILTVMMDATDLPDWATFTADGSSAEIASNAGEAWTLILGRFTGTSPASGITYDDAAIQLADTLRTSTTIEGPPAELNLWLWGRGSLDTATVTGDQDLVERIRAAAVEATQ